ncbi:MAG: hypothetical protein IKQ45_03510 [Clostridia bacterium]|nr:hypothetical protein [Clostridia bacterium]
MNGSITLYLVIAALMVIVTAIRAANASKNSKAQKEQESYKKAELSKNAEKMENDAGAHADASFSSAAAVMKLEKTQGKLFCSMAGENTVLPLSDIASVELIDHSADYRHCQEMARLHKGVERHSLYRPYGNHSIREVKEGFRRFGTYSGQMIYGARVRCKNGDLTDIPGYYGSGSLYWEEDKQLNLFREFLDELRKALR